MKISELKILIDAAESLGHGDAKMVLNDSRDGNESYPTAKATLKKCGTQQDPDVMLVISYE